MTPDLSPRRDYAEDKHRTVDDTPYGGGPGMVMKPEPWFKAIRAVLGEGSAPGGGREIILLTPRGEQLTQEKLRRLSNTQHIILLCGRYEGIDDRVRMRWVTAEISIGDFVINGGELPAQVLIEGIARLMPGALGDPESAKRDSFSEDLLDHRHFTKPAKYENIPVPDVLLSGNHEKIRKWRLRDSLLTTRERRPDLMERKELSEEEKSILRAAEGEGQNTDSANNNGEK